MKIEKVKTIVTYNVELNENELTCIYEIIKAKVKSNDVCTPETFDIYKAIKPLREEKTGSEIFQRN